MLPCLRYRAAITFAMPLRRRQRCALAAEHFARRHAAARYADYAAFAAVHYAIATTPRKMIFRHAICHIVAFLISR